MRLERKPTLYGWKYYTKKTKVNPVKDITLQHVNNNHCQQEHSGDQGASKNPKTVSFCSKI